MAFGYFTRTLGIGGVEATQNSVLTGDDPNLFVKPRVLTGECARHGVRLEVRGLRPSMHQMVRWLLTRRGAVSMVPTWSTAVLYQGRGVRV